MLRSWGPEPESPEGAEQEATVMAQIKRVGHVVLGVHDVQWSIEFYTRVLGMDHVGSL